MFLGSPHRDNPTYSCPWVNTADAKSNPHFSRDWPCALLNVNAYASRTGNCSLRIKKGKSDPVVDNGILGINSTAFSSFSM